MPRPLHLFSALTDGQKTAVLTAAVIITNVLGNVMLSHGMQQVGPTLSFSPLAYAQVALNHWAVLGVVVLCSWMVLNLALLSRADLTFVLPMTASAYVLIAILGHFWLGEPAGLIRWFAVSLISVGAALAGETPPKTTDAPPEDLL